MKLLFRKPIESLVNDEIHQARRDLLQAAANAEHWSAIEGMLTSRIRRLTDANARVLTIGAATEDRP